MKTIIVWYRNDLRVHDHPALAKAAQDGDAVVPLFILDPKILKGRHASANRNRFLLECLQDLKDSLKAMGADLVIRTGDTVKELQRIVDELDAEAVYYTADYSPFAIHRDKQVHSLFEKTTVSVRSFSGRLIVSSVDKLATKTGTPHKVFTPFFNAWQQVGRRALAGIPQNLRLPPHAVIGSLPKLSDIAHQAELSPDVLKGGESEARKRLKHFLAGDIKDYHEQNNDLAADATSRLSAYLRESS